MTIKTYETIKETTVKDQTITLSKHTMREKYAVDIESKGGASWDFYYSESDAMSSYNELVRITKEKP